MDTVTISDLRELVSIENSRCVSLFMPTHPSCADDRQDETRLKNLIAKAQDELVRRGMSASEAREFVTPIVELTHRSEWGRRKRGLAVFRSPGTFTPFWLADSLDESIVVGKRFRIKPLLAALRSKMEFYVLTISCHDVRLLKATSNGFERLHPVGFPSGMEATLNLQGAERGEQVHTGMRGVRGKEGSVYHGQGGHRDTMKGEFVEYCRAINDSLRHVLRQSPGPVVLVGVDYGLGIFRGVSDADILGNAMHGAFDQLSDRALYEKALPLAAKHFDAKRPVLARYESLVNRNRTSEDLDEIIAAAYQGKVDTLAIDCRAEVFGNFDAEKKSLELVEENDPALDLIELAAEQTIAHQGLVCAAPQDEMPSGAAMCAIFRY